MTIARRSNNLDSGEIRSLDFWIWVGAIRKLHFQRAPWTRFEGGAKEQSREIQARISGQLKSVVGRWRDQLVTPWPKWSRKRPFFLKKRKFQNRTKNEIEASNSFSLTRNILKTLFSPKKQIYITPWPKMTLVTPAPADPQICSFDFLPRAHTFEIHLKPKNFNCRVEPLMACAKSRRCVRETRDS